MIQEDQEKDDLIFWERKELKSTTHADNDDDDGDDDNDIYSSNFQ